MLALLDQTKEPFVASEVEADIAKTAVERLKDVAATNEDIRIVVRERPDIVVPLPARAVGLILRLLEAMRDRTPISLIPHEAELSTQQAADYLNVSRPFLTRLIDDKKIAHRLVGRHRRVRFVDLLEFEKQSRKDRRDAIAELAEEARRLELK